LNVRKAKAARFPAPNESVCFSDRDGGNLLLYLLLSICAEADLLPPDRANHRHHSKSSEKMLPVKIVLVIGNKINYDVFRPDCQSAFKTKQEAPLIRRAIRIQHYDLFTG
jgi:hypothetical protein